MSSLYLREWKCRNIPVPPAKKRQTDAQITDVWLEMVFGGDKPRQGAELVKSKYSGQVVFSFSFCLH